MRLPKPQRDEAEKLVAEYLRNGGSVHRDARTIWLSLPVLPPHQAAARQDRR